jgi:hypothetical protein
LFFYCTKRQLKCGDETPDCQRRDMSENELYVFRSCAIAAVVVKETPAQEDNH